MRSSAAKGTGNIVLNRKQEIIFYSSSKDFLAFGSYETLTRTILGGRLTDPLEFNYINENNILNQYYFLFSIKCI